jgi:hypothetical protein
VPGILSLRHPPLANNSSGSPNEPPALQEVGPSFHFISYCCLHRILVSLLDVGEGGRRLPYCLNQSGELYPAGYKHSDKVL